MPSDGSGNYSLAGGYFATTGTTIEVSQHNPPLEDIAAGLTARVMRNGAGGMTGPLKLTDGSEGAPSLTFGSAPTWGLYKTATGIALAINGAFVSELGGVPTGVMLEFPGVTAPSGYLLCYGQAVNRADYPLLFAALTTTVVGNTNTSTTLNGLAADLRGLGLEGAYIEGDDIPGGTTIASIDSASSLTLSQAATGSSSGSTYTILPHGQGNGSTTFNIPDGRGRKAAGRDDMGGSAANRITVAGGNFDAKRLAGVGGAQNHTLTQAQLPVDLGTATTTLTPALNTAFSAAGGSLGPSAGVNATATITAATTITNPLGGNAHPIVDPTRIVNYIIKT